MKILIAEDDYASRKFMYSFLSKYGECDLAVDGMEAVESFIIAIKEQRPYDLVCLDIMMPRLNGIKTLKAMRDIENKEGVLESNRSKIIMTTALDDAETVLESYKKDCEAYAVKPINLLKFVEVMTNLGLL
jgi:two-component system chemotaxis response regulator CheY